MPNAIRLTAKNVRPIAGSLPMRVPYRIAGDARAPKRLQPMSDREDPAPDRLHLRVAQTRRPFMKRLMLAALFLITSTAIAAPDLKGKTIVLVHGAFADGSSWAKVIPLLEARGLKVVAVQNPLSSLDDDVGAATRAIEQQTGPVILVGHSWGGAVITQAGNHEKVKALVYVSAFAPDSGQSINDASKGSPPPPWASMLVKDSGNFLTLPTANILSDFAQDLPPADARLIAATQGPW